MNKISIYLLPLINFIILTKNKNKFIYIYSNKLFLCLNINNYTIIYKNSINLIELISTYPFKEYKKINNFLNHFLFSWTTFFYKKIMFTGKGFKIKKKKKIVFFFFNKSHVSLVICNTAIIKKINKNKLLFFYKNTNFYNTLLTKILQIRYANIYTKRGLRFSRQIILKRKGKGGVQPQ